MIIDVPFVSRVPVIPPRGRASRLVWVEELESLSLRELDEVDFPVAAVFTEGGQDARHGNPEPIHSDGRRFFRQSLIQDIDDFKKALPMGDTIFGLHQWLAADGGRSMVRRADIVGRVVDDPRAFRLAELAAVGANVVVCNGRVYEVCGEPCFHWIWRNFAIAAALLDQADLVANPSLYIRADRLQEHLSDAGLPENRQIEILGTIEVLRPDLLKLSTATPRLVKAVAETVKYLEGRLGRDIMAASRSDLDAFASLRDALMFDPDGRRTRNLGEIARDRISPELSAAISDFLTIYSNGRVGELAQSYSRWLAEQIPEIEVREGVDPDRGKRLVG